MKLFVLLPFSVFVGNGYVMHAGAECLDHHNQSYHVISIFNDIKLPDAKELGCGVSLPIGNAIAFDQ